MRSKRVICFGLAVVSMAAALTVGAGALEYTLPGVESAEYYPATNYEQGYGSRYNYGGQNVIDYEIPELSYGVVSTAAMGPMEKVRLPGLNVSFDGASLLGGIVSDLFIEEVDVSAVGMQSAYTSIEGMEREDGSIGTVTIPALDISVNVFEGESSESMAKGLGHYSATSAWNGNVGVCGHNRGAKYVIGGIKDLEIGDTITYTTVYGTRAYKVSFAGTISANDWSYLQTTADNRITLTTCLADQPEKRVCVQAVEVLATH